jgi:hypothetical protein
MLPELLSAFRYECLDACGRLVLEGVSEPGLPIHLDSLSNGMYALKVWSGNLYYTARFVKQSD